MPIVVDDVAVALMCEREAAMTFKSNSKTPLLPLAIRGARIELLAGTLREGTALADCNAIEAPPSINGDALTMR